LFAEFYFSGAKITVDLSFAKLFLFFVGEAPE